MKIIAKLSVITAAFAAIAGTAALADDPQLQNRLAIERAQASAKQEPTVAVYANRRGLSQQNASSQRSETRFELRPNAHGGVTGAYVAGH